MICDITHNLLPGTNTVLPVNVTRGNFQAEPSLMHRGGTSIEPITGELTGVLL